MTVLEMDRVVKEYRLRNGLRHSTLRAVDDVSLSLRPGNTTALVGQSGSGKSTIAKLLTQLERPTRGHILLDGHPVGTGRAAEHAYRGAVQMVFQDPFASLNPFHTIGHHLSRPVALHHRAMTDEQVQDRVLQLLERVQLTPAAEFVDRRPHELSGGQRQRVAIARALAPDPGILVADEPVSMLDVSIRLEVLNLLAGLQQEKDLGVLYITHDLATARHFSDDILVLYHGEVVERGPADQVILDPQHEYTGRLLDASPDPERRLRQSTE